jgi:hypothetical protein
MKIIVPSNINYENMESELPGRIQRRRATMESIYFFLSQLYPNESYKDQYAYFNYYRNIKSTRMNRLTRNRLNEIKIILLNESATPNGPIISCDDVYMSGVKSHGYKLSDWLFEDPGYLEVEIHNKFQDRLNKIFEEDYDLRLEFESHYDHIKRSLDTAQITIDPSVHEFISVLQEKMIEVSPATFIPDVQRYIDQLMILVTLIENGEFNYNVTKKTHRVSTVFTSLKRELRYFLRINGKRVTEVDLISSQAFVLSTILTEKFFNDQDEGGYNLFSLYPQMFEYYRLYVSKLEEGIQLNLDNIEYINRFYNVSNPITSSNTIYNIIKLEEGGEGVTMYGGFWNSPSIENYRDFDFSQDIYQMFADEVQMDRQTIKDQFIHLLHYKNKQGRNHIEFIQHFKNRFPDVNRLIELLANFKYMKNPFSLLLMRAESYLLLRIGCEALPDFPFITIHDSVLCTEDNAATVEYILGRWIAGFTRLKVGIKVKPIANPYENLDGLAVETVSKIIEDIEDEKNEYA